MYVPCLCIDCFVNLILIQIYTLQECQDVHVWCKRYVGGVCYHLFSPVKNIFVYFGNAISIQLVHWFSAIISLLCEDWPSLKEYKMSTERFGSKYLTRNHGSRNTVFTVKSTLIHFHCVNFTQQWYIYYEDGFLCTMVKYALINLFYYPCEA